MAMNYFQIEPEVAGGWGKNTVVDVSVHPPLVKRLHYQFDGWLGDALIESFPCFIITANTADALQRANLSGFQCASVEISRSEQFIELNGDKKLPAFQWLKIDGVAGNQDFGISKKGLLVVSEAALKILRQFGIENCDIREWSE